LGRPDQTVTQTGFLGGDFRMIGLGTHRGA
jgi:hypothetical protein